MRPAIISGRHKDEIYRGFYFAFNMFSFFIMLSENSLSLSIIFILLKGPALKGPLHTARAVFRCS